jgi:hypothetical protein
VWFRLASLQLPVSCTQIPFIGPTPVADIAAAPIAVALTLTWVLQRDEPWAWALQDLQVRVHTPTGLPFAQYRLRNDSECSMLEVPARGALQCPHELLQGIALLLLVLRTLRVPSLKVASILLPLCLLYDGACPQTVGKSETGAAQYADPSGSPRPLARSVLCFHTALDLQHREERHGSGAQTGPVGQGTTFPGHVQYCSTREGIRCSWMSPRQVAQGGSSGEALPMLLRAPHFGYDGLAGYSMLGELTRGFASKQPVTSLLACKAHVCTTPQALATWSCLGCWWRGHGEWTLNWFSRLVAQTTSAAAVAGLTNRSLSTSRDISP